MSGVNFPLLSLVILLPFLGGIVTGITRDLDLAKTIALTFAILELFLTFLVLQLFDSSTNSFQLTEKISWISLLNVEYLLGVDGISVLFLPLSALLTIIAMLASWNSVNHSVRFHFALLLALQGATTGVFCALDMVLFFLFWELTLPPFFFLIGLWGIGSQRRGAAMKYTLFMLAGGVALLLAIIILSANHAIHINGDIPQDLSFSLPVLLEVPLPDDLQTLVFLLLLFGFAVKAPLVPFHTWLPTAAMEGPAHIAALLTGLKLGVYGILRFTMPLAPVAANEFSWILSVFGAATLIYGGLIAMRQTNLRRLLAYASVSHVGMVMVGIASLNMQGIQGAIFQLLNFTLIASSLMLIAGFIHHRLGSTEAIHLGGVASVAPRLAFFYFLFALASFGVPGTSGFPAELLMIIGALTSHAGLGAAALAGAILGAAYMLSFTRRAFFGPVVHQTVSKVHDLQTRELVLLSIPAFLILAFGFFPDIILNINQIASEAWLSRLSIYVP
ncbi:MAG TPA: oxidoreductase [Nitrosomonas nitrosa]|uniref:complex I subunit 4 family protein n=1 Tax=Nitrosomonas nitrosa TaxID=52442 RepID=UPI000EE5CD15|nr:NADH-quinone oxidoreductase subunit M [Nitrosomonas nitrosa]MCO6435118.1 NADH-quinone oxidoreductase subunit M [Nitrosomonas nitrosa]HBZ30148.1 oxidoreductase [Nitrosomonas nitrosa]HNP51321.1 NADH-quinone oxidoreductase subunit M [Nitrosomonas nitrosa]